MTGRARSDLQPAQLDELLGRWGLSSASARPLREGEIKLSWAIDRPASLLHVYPPTVPLAAVQQEIAWTEAMRPAIKEIPEPITSSRGRLVESTADGCAAVLRRFIDGHPPDETGETGASMADVLGRIHREAARLGLRGESWFSSLRRFDWTSNPWWDLPSIGPLETAYLEVGAARRQLEEVPKLFDRLGGLPECLIHNDFHRGNLIARGSEIVGVVDWDWATIDWRILDVAAGMRSWMLRPGLVGFAAAVGFVDRYSRSVGDFSPAERHYLPDVLWLRSLWTVFYDLGRAVDGGLDAESLQYRLDNHQQLQEVLPGLWAALADRSGP